jgi:hypothetical protein
MAEPFYEDFFERVIDVKWETEPEVFWMAGTGVLSYINGAAATGDGRAWLFTSEDGKSWEGQDIGINTYVDPGEGSNNMNLPRGFGSIVSGGWIREGLKAGATPVWVLVGSDGKFQPGSAALASLDGKFPARLQYFDDRHVAENFVVTQEPDPDGSGGGEVGINSKSTISNFDTDAFRSSDGQVWTPGNYHPRAPHE